MSIAELKAKSFEEVDKENLIKLLNLIHLKISNLSGKESFEYYQLMSWAQQVLLPKINDNIMGVPQLHETKEAK